ncbi:MAG: hypothetical protein JWM46_642 [Candidatus Kaiserbacteria bacterium]|nr:hypothetical protein [Candidatus Kaiserbacteria bacterium]
MVPLDYIGESAMKRSVIAALVAVGLLVIPASAQDANRVLVDSISQLRDALQLVWKVAANPVAIFEHIDYSELRTMQTDEGRVQAIYRDAAQKLNPDTLGRTDPFTTLRSKYADHDVLHAAYDANKQTALGAVAKAAIKGTVVNLLIAGTPVLGKPLTLNAASAGEWFRLDCYEPEDKQYEPARCKTNFAKTFKEDYGVEATRSNVYVLMWLHRRYLEGGPKLVAEWQRIGLDLSKEYVQQKTCPPAPQNCTN